jgi:hypothetical protein
LPKSEAPAPSKTAGGEAMKTIGRSWLVFFLIGLISLCLPVDGATSAGARFGVYTNAGKLFIGGELNIPVYPQVYFNPNLEYVFVSSGSYFSFNFDFHYDFAVSRPLYVWAGGGLAVISRTDDGSHANAGLNLLFGVGVLTSGPIIPYVQAKGVISSNSEFVLGFGIRF